jgi:hypothetical protein
MAWHWRGVVRMWVGWQVVQVMLVLLYSQERQFLMAVEQAGSIVHMEEHPSPEIVLPSSHC